MTDTKSPMSKAFRTVRGAIKRRDKIELVCKKTWLERVIKDLPNTLFSQTAEEGLKQVDQVLSEI